MNTRLQVEHPVTELITGIDLVEQMIRVAAGEKLSIKQGDVKRNGWAVESRIYAEDPYRGFLPSIGRLKKYRAPKEGARGGATVRVDTGVKEGGEISLFYDPMIAKLVTHAGTREKAIDAMAEALDDFAIEGVEHNISFVAALMHHPRWREGKLSTGFIAEEYPQGFQGRPLTDDLARRLAAVASAMEFVLDQRKQKISGRLIGRDFQTDKNHVVRFNDRELALEVMRQGDAVAVRFGSEKVKQLHVLQSHWLPGDPLWRGTFDGEEMAVHVKPVANGFELSHEGVREKFYSYTDREAALARLMPKKTSAASGKSVRCPMPGLVLSIAVKTGQEIKTGETLAIVEAMKMENVLRAERDGTIKDVKVKQGDSVAVDAVILEFE